MRVRLFLFFSLLLLHQPAAFGMRKLIDKLKPSKKPEKKKHQSDKNRDLRKPWMCECDNCTEQMRIENDAHAAEMRKRDHERGPDQLGMTPEQVEKFKQERERKRIEIVWQAREAMAQRIVEQAERPKRRLKRPEKPQKKWGVEIGVPAQQVPPPRIIYPTQEASIEPSLHGLYVDPYAQGFKQLFEKEFRVSFSDEDML